MNQNNQNKLLDVIYGCLNTSKNPLTAEELLELIILKKLYVFGGKTPKTAIRARLSTDIDKLESSSRFVRLSKGTYGLRSWLLSYPGKYKEYSFRKSQEIKMNEYLAVFSREKLNEIIPGPGFHLVDIPTDWFKSNCSSLVRYDAEVDFSVIQLISVFIIKHENEILIHIRSQRAPEERLHGEKSIILGGHITYEDVYGFFDPFDPNSPAPCVERELIEEVKIRDDYKLEPLGLLYDDSREVSSQHLGICYLVEMTTKNYRIGEKGYHIQDEMVAINKVEKNLSEFENWSQTLIRSVDIFKNNKTGKGGL